MQQLRALRSVEVVYQGGLADPHTGELPQLLTDFPADELQTKPQPVVSGRDQVRGSVSIPILREFDQLARERDGNLGPALDEALAAWIAKNKPPA